MLANIDEIVADVRSLLDEASAATNKFWIDAEIVRWANEGSEKFTSFTRVLSKLYEYTINADDVANDRELRLSSDFITFDEGGVLYNDISIPEMSLLEADEWKGSTWRNQTSTVPIAYYRRGDGIGFIPSLTAGDVIKYYGIERTPTMVLEDEVAPLSGDYRMVAFRPYIRDYAISKCWYKKGEFKLAKEMMKEFRDGIALVNQVVHGERNQVKKMIPARRRISRRAINALNM